ncbi:Transcriptional regulators of sugar metabolism [Escherichia coli]|nr:Transcriptional regulators of sugar metabolism [Escherichia coli]KGM77389.1 Transcriptional regulators of sugar metabolism [Escherichia coli]KGM80035.1 Transcriptional regulators of sugar metabolism [Escherichia coli]
MPGLRRQYRRQRVRLRRETYIAICGEKRNSCPCPNNDQRWRLLFSRLTCLELAKCLADARVKVICNDIKIANELGCFPHVESYIIGGLIRPGYFSVGESLALEMINAFSVERAFISCDALSLETGITNATMFEVGVKTRIIQRSREVILMADHSKFDAVEPHAVATLSCIKTIISDSGLPETIAQRYQRAGCQLFLPHSIK